MDTPQKKKTLDTSWQSVASWYDVLLETDQDITSTSNCPKSVAYTEWSRQANTDLACGQGIFPEYFMKLELWYMVSTPRLI